MLKNNLDAYNASAVSFDERIGGLTNYDEAYDALASLLGESPSVLDTACGPGNISAYIARKVPHASFVLMDLSEGMLKVARSHLPEAELIEHDICSFDLGRKFDAVINGFGLPYLSPEDALRHFSTVYSHLKENGLYYLSFMNVNEERHPGMKSYTQDEHPSFNPSAYITVTYHSQEVILRQLQETGFTLVKRWNLDYRESDGSITTDVVMILRKADCTKAALKI